MIQRRCNLSGCDAVYAAVASQLKQGASRYCSRACLYEARRRKSMRQPVLTLTPADHARWLRRLLLTPAERERARAIVAGER